VTANSKTGRNQTSLSKNLCRLISFLLENDNGFFSDDYLNSEGRKLFERIVEIILELNPEYSRRITIVRKKGSKEEVASLLSDIGEKHQCW